MSWSSSAPHWTLSWKTNVSLFGKMEDLNNENITPLVMHRKEVLTP
jgi:hypothetical protein